MKTKYIDIKDEWGIIIVYGYNILDYDTLWAYMRSFGVSDEKAREALRVLGGTNTGMCVSNEDLRMSIIFISQSATMSDFLNTLSHELKHAADAIVDYFGVDHVGEDAAHLSGFLMQQALDEMGITCSI